MKKIDRPTQLNLFVVSGQSGALIESTCDSINVHLNLIQVDIEALRGELLSWGAKHRYPCFGGFSGIRVESPSFQNSRANVESH